MITNITEYKDVAKYILTRGLLSQYRKAKQYILEGNTEQVDFKIRQPKSKGRYQFRINRKYRAFCYFETETDLKIFEISDHQDF